MNNIPMVDLKGQYQKIKSEIDEAVLKVLGASYALVGVITDKHYRYHI